MSTTAKEIADWLMGEQCRCRRVEWGTVVLFGTSYPAVEYWQPRPVPGSHHSDPTNHLLYVHGEVPKQYKRSSRICFTRDDSPYEWYVSGYMALKNLKPENAHYHPFGVYFQMAPHTSPEPIDRYEAWTRHKMLFQKEGCQDVESIGCGVERPEDPRVQADP